MKLDDNVVPGPWVKWDPPYHFIVGRRVKWDGGQDQIVEVINSSIMAYAIFKQYMENDVMTEREYLWEWFITDSFNRDALNYCKQKYDAHLNGTLPEEETKKA